MGLIPSVAFLGKYADIPPRSNLAAETPAPPQSPSGFSSAPIFVTIIPFRLLGQSEQHAFLSETIPEGIISRLTRQKWFDVQVKGAQSQDHTAQSTDGIRYSYAVYGSIRVEPDKIVISARLTEHSNGKIIWSHTYENPRVDKDTISAESVDQISETILTKMVDSAAEHAFKNFDQIPASMWIDTMKARHLFWKTSRENNDAARALLAPVIEHDMAPISALVTAVFTRLLHVWSIWDGDLEAQMKDAMRIAEKTMTAI